MRRNLHIALYVVLAAAGYGVLVKAIHGRTAANAAFAREVQANVDEAKRVADEAIVYTSAPVISGITFSDDLRRMGVDSLAAAAIASSSQAVFDARRFHAGNLLSVGRSVTGSLRSVRYQID